MRETGVQFTYLNLEPPPLWQSTHMPEAKFLRPPTQATGSGLHSPGVSVRPEGRSRFRPAQTALVAPRRPSLRARQPAPPQAEGTAPTGQAPSGAWAVRSLSSLLLSGLS